MCAKVLYFLENTDANEVFGLPYYFNFIFRGERKCYYDNAFIEDDGLVEEHLNKVYSNKSAKV